MTTLGHSVRKQTLSVACDSTDCAMALRERLGDLNTTRLIPVIERVLGEMAVAGRQIRVDRLEVNLGDIPFSEVETMLPARLYEKFKEAIEGAIHSPFATSGQSEIASRLELLDWYLRRGTLPWWASSPASFSCSAWFLELAQEAPAALAGMIRQMGADDTALQRIVQQLDVRGLQRLVAVLDAEHAELILAYIFDLGELHRDEPLAAVEPAAFDRLTWLLVLSFLIRQAGSQFNRKMLIASLLEGFALHEEVRYGDILMLLRSGLERTLARHGFLSSLPSVIAELLDDAGIPASLASPTIEHFEAGANNSDFAGSDPARLAQLVRAFGSDWNWLERLVAALDEETLIAVIGLLEPEQAATVIAFLFDVGDAHREEPLATDPKRFGQFLWVLAISHLVRDSGSEFNRKAFLLSLVERLVRDSEFTLESVLATLQVGLQKATRRAPLRSSLPAILGSLLQDLGRAPVDGPPEGPPGTSELSAAMTDAPLARDGQMAQLRLEQLRSAQLSTAQPDTAQLHMAQLRAALAAVRQMPVSAVRNVLTRVAPSLDAPGSLMAEAFRSAVEGIADPRAFYARLIVAAANGENLDFEQLRAESEEGEPLPQDLRQWDYAALKAAIAMHFTAGLEVRGESITLPALVAALFQREPQDARQFLKSLAGNAAIFDELARSFAPEEFHQLLDQIAGPNARSLKTFLGACRELSAADRPAAGVLQSLALTEVMFGDSLHEMEREAFERILRAAFPAPLPSRIRESLLASIRDEAPILRAALSADSGVRASGHQPVSMPEALANKLAALMESRTGADYQAIRELLADRQTRQRLQQTLPRTQLTRLAQLLDPGQAHVLLQAAGVLARAWALAVPAMPGAEIEEAIWTSLFELLAEGSASVMTLTAKALERFRLAAPRNASVLTEFHRRSQQLAAEAGLATLREALEAAPIAREPQSPAPRPKAVTRPEPGKRDADDCLYAPNAGLVLASPFLPHFFSQLDMLRPVEKRRSEWRDDHAASRAVHLLQYLVDGSASTPEPMLTLNKILCGLPTSAPTEREIELSAAEKEVCEKLLHAIIANWSIISNTSIAGLRETFLLREGKLERSGEAWKLRVQRKTLDVLVDQVPWTFSTVFHDWMSAPVHVTW